MEEKHFDEWIEVKEKLHFGGSMPKISEGDIWWCSCGENVGVEINGKGERFARPVLVFTKFGRLSFLGIPLTTKRHDGPWYAEYIFNGETKYAVLCQVRASFWKDP